MISCFMFHVSCSCMDGESRGKRGRCSGKRRDVCSFVGWRGVTYGGVYDICMIIEKCKVGMVGILAPRN